VHEVVRVGAGLGAVLRGALKEARDGQDGRLGRNFLSSRHGDRLNAILCGVRQNVRLLLRWFALLLCFFLRWLYEAVLSDRSARLDPQS